MTLPQQLSREGRSVQISDAVTPNADTFAMLLSEGDVDYGVERTLRVSWNGITGFAAGFREVATVRVIATGNGVAETLFYAVPPQGMAIRCPPGKVRVDVRFPPGGPTPAGASLRGRIDPGRPAHREVIATSTGQVPPGPISFDPFSDPNAAFSVALKLQVLNSVALGPAWDLSLNGIVTAGLPPGTYQIDPRAKADITVLAGSVLFAWWVVYE